VSPKKIGLIAGGVLAIIVAAVVAVFALSGGAEPEAAPAPLPATTTTTARTVPPPPPVLAPLTGLPVDAAITKPALVIKIDNADVGARPQVGLNKADIVYEEKVEGGVTRFAAVFHSQGSNPVGPVRSGRTTDIGIVYPLHRPLYAYSGANTVVEAELATAPLINVGAPFNPEPYWRQPGRPAPYNLFSSTDGLWGLTPPDAQPPTPLFTYRADGQDSAGDRVGAVALDFGGGASAVRVRYDWNVETKTWERTQNETPHVDEDGTRFAPENVVVQFVDYLDSGLVDTTGNASPVAQLVGEGDAWIFADGKLQIGRWSRPNLESVTSFTDAAGGLLTLTPGKTWVELLPIGAAALVQDCKVAPDSPGCQ
jgi:hypothetical protein